jgi:hypothetical protein
MTGSSAASAVRVARLDQPAIQGRTRIEVVVAPDKDNAIRARRCVVEPVAIL